MEAQPSEDRDMLLTCFNGISDPLGSNSRHPLQSVLFIVSDELVERYLTV